MAEAIAAARPHGRLHLKRVLILALLVVALGAAASLFGWNLSGWFKDLWKTITGIGTGYLLAAFALVTIQTVTTAFAWYSILRFAYHLVSWRQVLACYATAVALNCVLPANLGSAAMVLMFVTIIPGATLAGVLAGFVVQKVFYTAIGVLTYLYLFLSVGGSFSLQFGFVAEHPIATIALVASTIGLLVMVASAVRERIGHWWEQAKDGGQIARSPRDYLRLVLLPEVVSWVAMLGIIAVFLAAYNIPVDFHTVMRVVGGNSIANMTSVTPGGAGVQQGFNVLALKGITSSSSATAYSVGQQLVTTAWSLFLALALMLYAFGWSEGKTLVRESYAGAKEKRAEQSAERKAKRDARREARREEKQARDA